MREESAPGAKLAMATSANIYCVPTLANRSSKYSNLLFISSIPSAGWTEQLVVCEFCRDRGPPVLLVLGLTAFTPKMVL